MEAERVKKGKNLTGAQAAIIISKKQLSIRRSLMESKRTIRLLALILLIIALGVGLFFLLKDRRQGPGGDPSAHATELTAEPADTSVPTDAASAPAASDPAASDPAAATKPAASTNPDVTADPDGTEDASVTSSPDVTESNATPTPAAPTQSPGSAPYVVPTVPAQPSVPADMTQTPAVPTQSNSASTPAPTPSPVPTPTPTAEPTGTPTAAYCNSGAGSRDRAYLA